MTKTEATKNVGGNTVADRMAQGVAAAVIVVLAGWKVYEWVNAPDYLTGVGLASLPIIGLLFLLITPFFRRAA